MCNNACLAMLLLHFVFYHFYRIRCLHHFNCARRQHSTPLLIAITETETLSLAPPSQKCSLSSLWAIFCWHLRKIAACLETSARRPITFLLPSTKP